MFYRYHSGWELFVEGGSGEKNMMTTLQLDGIMLRKYLEFIETTYCYSPDVPNHYHTAVHAADVLQTTAVLTHNEAVYSKLDLLELFSTYFAAMIHDYRHPGVDSKFLIATNDRLVGVEE